MTDVLAMIIGTAIGFPIGIVLFVMLADHLPGL